MSKIAIIAFVLLAAISVNSAQAASVVFTVTGQSDLDDLGVIYSVGGGATLDTSGPFPVVTMPVESSSTFPGGGNYFLTSSTVTAQLGGDTLELTSFLLMVNDQFINPPDTIGILFADAKLTVNSVSTLLNNFTVGIVSKSTLDLVLSPELTNVLAAKGFVGLRTIANVTLPTPIPLPGGLALYAGALALFGAARVLRRKQGMSKLWGRAAPTAA
jgi:hypothetical protein